MTATANPAQGSWSVGTVPFATKYGVLNNVSTSSPRGTIFDPYTSPDALYINGEQGVWYDPSDFSTMWQDSAGTIPVTAVEQPVGKILDKSGRDHHATQATSASRPILKQDANGKYYLFFDGVDASLATTAIDFTATDKMTVVAGVRKLSDAATGVLLELSANSGGNSGTFALFAPSSATAATYLFRNRGTASSENTSAAAYSAPITNVISCSGVISTDTNSLKVTTGTTTTVATDQGTGNFGNYPLYIGARAGTSLFFNGNLYNLIVRGAASSASQIASTESYVAQKTGVTL